MNTFATYSVDALSLAQCPDEYRRIRDIRLAMEKETEIVKAVETALKERLVRDIPKDSAGVFGLMFKAQIVAKKTATVSDEAGGWAALQSFIKQYDRFDLIQKRINAPAVLELIEQGYAVPGTQRMTTYDVSVTKV